MSIDPEKVSLKVGIELHRQLRAKRKLFCHCPPGKEEGVTRFYRRLRPSQSELGEVDPAALFESRKGGVIRYQSGPDFSCLVEADEEPPHDPDPYALETALIVAQQLGSSVVDELHVMRKMVIDGSNTGGFQRTMVVALGGRLTWKEGSAGEVSVQTVTLEEDAARILGERGEEKGYALDRLGVPLIEISLAPVTASPAQAESVALALGRLLKSTGRMERGLGTVRQDINVSVLGGSVVEVKGVQQPELISKVVEFEAMRQLWLHELSVRLKQKGASAESFRQPPRDITDLFRSTATGSRVISSGIRAGGSVLGLRVPFLRGLLKDEPNPGVRLGKELADLARFYGLGGLIHSDELPGQGITEEEVSKVRAALGCADDDGFLLLVGEMSRLRDCMQALTRRLEKSLDGAPAETRAATADGQTRYLRPRPGSARMYPETDIQPIPVIEEDLLRARSLVPRPWDQQVLDCSTSYGLSMEQAERILDSDYYELFRKACAETKAPASVVASVLTETLVSIRREGADTDRIDDAALLDAFRLVGEGSIAKEALHQLLSSVARGEAKSIQEAAAKVGLSSLSLEDLRRVILQTIEDNKGLIESRGEAAFSPLMGSVMAKVRGRVDGSVVSTELRIAISGWLARSSSVSRKDSA